MKAILIILNLILMLIIANQDLQAQDKKSKKEQEQEYLENIKKDSIAGVYIPTDLNDCFKQIDSFWADSIKTQVRDMTEGEFAANAHFGFGMWMRNNWRLWGGSRPDSPSFATRGLWLFVYNKEICNPSMIYYGFYLQNYLLCV